MTSSSPGLEGAGHQAHPAIPEEGAGHLEMLEVVEEPLKMENNIKSTLLKVNFSQQINHTVLTLYVVQYWNITIHYSTTFHL